jgi:hypothetical protein
MIQISIFTIICSLICLICLIYSVNSYKKLTKQLKINIEVLKDCVEIRNKMIILLQDRIEWYGLKGDYKHYSKQELELPC